ncbi:16S rRNA (cytosine(1402)-N(4))-methyltransferase RsmH [Limnoglobus roseus]|uniref:Ribosomal RNA small subunit methyltransferase H n=1 Tax=Limnoglobus roseus TaxID=2598579 RepID=A0A5C1AD17_9BACT|nr:16S rRNA (cytosine(1402)-N(4))-methyltransferase RsmH [Limnoglobus roseus]QEL17191.1 16S rRNA (cytosine(1402)-N(4))-methyltransferase RsmH [Limnoglobus roseus]
MPPRSDKPWSRKFRKPGERSTAAGEHVPVMLAECLAALNVQPGHMVVDCTLGFGGHSLELLKRVGPEGRLIALDLDGENLPKVEPKLTEVGNPFTLHHGNFAGLASVLAGQPVDGVLADLGFSSMQVDDAERGFSFMRDGPLDMRMDRTRGQTAADLLNTIPVDELATAFRELGDEPEAEKIAGILVNAREKKPFSRTQEVRDLIRHGVPVRTVRHPGSPPERKQMLLPTTRVFQTLRILVNREFANLQQLLRVIPTVLKPGGVAAIISFHSGEDRLVKAAFRDGQRAGIYQDVADDPERPTEAEKSANPRSRSAKLRWAKRAAD